MKTERASRRHRGGWQLAGPKDCRETAGAEDEGSRHMQTYEMMCSDRQTDKAVRQTRQAGRD